MASRAAEARRRREERREAGLCSVAGCPNYSGSSYYCPAHADGRPRVLAVSRDLHDRLVKAAESKGARLSVLTEVLLEKGLKELRSAA